MSYARTTLLFNHGRTTSARPFLLGSCGRRCRRRRSHYCHWLLQVLPSPNKPGTTTSNTNTTTTTHQHLPRDEVSRFCYDANALTRWRADETLRAEYTCLQYGICTCEASMGLSLLPLSLGRMAPLITKPTTPAARRDPRSASCENKKKRALFTLLQFRYHRLARASVDALCKGVGHVENTVEHGVAGRLPTHTLHVDNRSQSHN